MPRNPSTASKWAEFAAIYDSFRVLAMRLRIFFPVAFQSDPSASTPTVLPGSAVSMYYDNDGDYAANFIASVDYNTLSLFAPLGEVSYTVSKLPTGKSFTGSTGTAQDLADSMWTNVQNASLLVGGIDSWISRGFTTAPSFTVVFEWDVEFREMAT